MFLGLSDDDYQNVLKIHNEPIPLNKHGEIQARKTLIHKCLYSITPLSSSFNLMRDEEVLASVTGIIGNIMLITLLYGKIDLINMILQLTMKIKK